MSLKNIYLEQHFKQVTAGCLLAFQSCFPFSAKKKKKKKRTLTYMFCAEFVKAKMALNSFKH